MTLSLSYQGTGSFSGSPFNYGFAFDNVSGNYYVAHVSLDTTSTIINPATEDTLALALTALQAIEAAAGPASTAQGSSLETLEGIATTLAAVATSAGQGASLTVLQAIAAATGAGATASAQASALTVLEGIEAATAKQPTLAYTDLSGITASNANTFSPLIAANTSRGYLRVSNTSASGTTIYVYDKSAGTASTTNSIPIPAGQHFVWDRGVPGSAIQVAGSAANLTFEACEGA